MQHLRDNTNMKTIINSLKPIWENHKQEAMLAGGALSTLLIAFIIFISTTATVSKGQEKSSDYDTYTVPSQAKIMVDLSGAVNKPGVYEAGLGSRLRDIIQMGGGLSSDADAEFFARNFNLARIINDQEKIHVPSKTEVHDGTFTENKKVVDFTKPQQIISSSYGEKSTIGKVNINVADKDQLVSTLKLSDANAQAIIDHRPYFNILDLKTNKVLKSTIYDKIKSKISI
jgi:competence protein ComEA